MTNIEIIAAYHAAIEASNASYHKFQPIRDAYHAGKISDAEFLAARAEHKAAQDAFDVAFNARRDLDWDEADEGQAEDEAAHQMAMF